MPKKSTRHSEKESTPMEVAHSRPPTPGGEKGEKSKEPGQEVTAASIKEYLESQGEKVESKEDPKPEVAGDIINIDDDNDGDEEANGDPLGTPPSANEIIAQEFQSYLDCMWDQQADRDDMRKTLMNQGLNMLQNLMLRTDRHHKEMMSTLVGIRADMGELGKSIKAELASGKGPLHGQAPQDRSGAGTSTGSGQHNMMMGSQGGAKRLPREGQGNANYLPGVLTSFTDQDIDISSKLEHMDKTVRQRSLRNWRKWVQGTILRNNTIAPEFRGVLDKGPYPNKIKDNNLCMANPCYQRMENRCSRWHGCGQCAVFLLQMGKDHSFLSQSCPVYSGLVRGLRIERQRKAK